MVVDDRDICLGFVTLYADHPWPQGYLIAVGKFGARYSAAVYKCPVSTLVSDGYAPTYLLDAAVAARDRGVDQLQSVFRCAADRNCLGTDGLGDEFFSFTRKN